jgi:hypothetical protein
MAAPGPAKAFSIMIRNGTGFETDVDSQWIHKENVKE